MEYARYSTALKTLSVAVLAGAVVLLGGLLLMQKQYQ